MRVQRSDDSRGRTRRSPTSSATVHGKTTPDDVLRLDAVDFEIDLDRIDFDVPVLRPIMDAGYTR